MQAGMSSPVFCSANALIRYGMKSQVCLADEEMVIEPSVSKWAGSFMDSVDNGVMESRHRGEPDWLGRIIRRIRICNGPRNVLGIEVE